VLARLHVGVEELIAISIKVLKVRKEVQRHSKRSIFKLRESPLYSKMIEEKETMKIAVS